MTEHTQTDNSLRNHTNSVQTNRLLLVSIILIAVATLAPLPPWPGDNRIVVISPTGFAWTDIVQNIVLFVPFGAALGLRFTAIWHTMMLSACVSIAVEASQLWIPGRCPALQDLITNILGAALGNALAQSRLRRSLQSALQNIDRVLGCLMYPDARLAAYLALAAGLVPTIIFLLTAVLLSPSLPATTYLVATNQIDTTPGPLRLGGTAAPDSHFMGKIDEIRIYNRALVIEEIRNDMRAAIKSTAPAAGLVAAYSLDEGEGEEARDASGNNNTGTVAGARWVSQGRFGNALFFDGLDDVVIIPGASSLDLRSEFTLEAWVNPAAAQVSWPAVLQKQYDAYFLYAGVPDGPRIFNGGGTFGGLNRGVELLDPLTANTWAHLALTYDGAALQFFVDGNATASLQLWSGNQVHNVSIAGIDLAAGACGRSTELRVLLLKGAAFKVETTIASDSKRTGALLRLVDAETSAHQRNLLSLGIDDRNVIFELRSLAASWGLPSPPLRAKDAIPKLSVQERLTITVSKTDGDYCLRVHDAARCGLGFSIASGWKLLLYSQYLPTYIALIFDIIWLAALAFPLGFLAHRSWAYLLSCVTFGLGVSIVPAATMLVSTPLHELIALVAGFTVGGVLRIFLHRV